jgi:hypothetical protein
MYHTYMQMSIIFFRNVLTASPVWMYPLLGCINAEANSSSNDYRNDGPHRLSCIFIHRVARVEGVGYPSTYGTCMRIRFRKMGRKSPHRRLYTQAAEGQLYHVLEYFLYPMVVVGPLSSGCQHVMVTFGCFIFRISVNIWSLSV